MIKSKRHLRPDRTPKIALDSHSFHSGGVYSSIKPPIKNKTGHCRGWMWWEKKQMAFWHLTLFFFRAVDRAAWRAPIAAHNRTPPTSPFTQSDMSLFRSTDSNEKGKINLNFLMEVRTNRHWGERPARWREMVSIRLFLALIFSIAWITTRPTILKTWLLPTVFVREEKRGIIAANSNSFCLSLSRSAWGQRGFF